jgi:hypothetical protein
VQIVLLVEGSNNGAAKHKLLPDKKRRVGWTVKSGTVFKGLPPWRASARALADVSIDADASVERTNWPHR